MRSAAGLRRAGRTGCETAACVRILPGPHAEEPSPHRGRAHRGRGPGPTRLIFGTLVTSICLVAALTGPARAAADQAAPSAAGIEAEAEYARAPVTLDGETLFSVRGVEAYPADKRAQVIGGRIRAMAADRSMSMEALRLVESERGTDILAGDRFLMTVTGADAKRDGVTTQFMARAVRQRIADAVEAYRSERTPKSLLIRTGFAMGATVAAWLLFLGVRRVFGWIDELFGRRAKGAIEGLETQAFRLIQAKQLVTALHGLVVSLRVLAIVAVVYVYLQVLLELYPWSRPLSRKLSAIFLDPLGSMGASFLDALPNLVFLGILILLTRYLLKLLKLFFTGVEKGAIAFAGFDPDWAWPTYRIIRPLVVAFAVVVAYPYIPGSQSAAFQGVSIFIGVIFSLGSSSLIANLIAGYSMTYRRTFRVGDRIQVGDVMGDVTESGLMVTRVRTPKNEEVVVPNSSILNNHIVNYSALAKQDGLILHTTVGIGYETPWRQVEAMLIMAAERTPGLLREPPPFVLQKNLGDFCVTYEINAHCDNPQAMARLYTDLHRHILDLFNEYGVQIMTPAYEGDPHQPKVVPREQWFAAPARAPETRPPTAPGAQP
jgi:small-conductance mechanosensitive channel